MVNTWIRVGIVMLFAAAAILVAGLLMPLTIAQPGLGTIDCGTALSFDHEPERIGAGSSCEQAALDRRTLVYLLAGFAGGTALIVLAYGRPQTARAPRKHPFM